MWKRKDKKIFFYKKNIKIRRIKTMTTELKHGQYYTCKRLRLLEYLLKRGHKPFKSVPDIYNWNYIHWVFVNTPKLEADVAEYFESKQTNK